MRIALVVCVLAATSWTAQAQDSDVVAACKKAIGVWLGTPSVEFRNVQDFSNLKPPRAQITDATLMSERYRCSFQKNVRPLGISKFCTSTSCREAGDERFDEIKEMLRRDGY
jgi:hypothetical protein